MTFPSAIAGKIWSKPGMGMRIFIEMLFSGIEDTEAATAVGLTFFARGPQLFAVENPNLSPGAQEGLEEHALRLSRSYPNPVHRAGTAWVGFTVQTETTATLGLYDNSGRLVANLFQALAQPDEIYQVPLHAASYGLSPGTYFITLNADGRTQTQKLIVSQ